MHGFEEVPQTLDKPCKIPASSRNRYKKPADSWKNSAVLDDVTIK